MRGCEGMASGILSRAFRTDDLPGEGADHAPFPLPPFWKTSGPAPRGRSAGLRHCARTRRIPPAGQPWAERPESGIASHPFPLPDRMAFPANPLMRSLPLSPAGLPRPLARFFRGAHKQLPIAFHDLPCVQGKCRNSPLRRIPAITFRRGRNCCAATIPQILPMHGTDGEPGGWIPIPPAMQIGFPCRRKDASTPGAHPARSSSVRPASSAALIHRGRRPRPDQVSS